MLVLSFVPTMKGIFMSMMLTPPENVQLEVAPVVEEVKVEQINELFPAPTPGRELELSSQAKSFVSSLSTMNVNSPEFASQVSDIQTLAQAEIVRSGSGSNTILQRRSNVPGGKKGDATTRVTSSLAELRSTVEDLTPNAADLTATKKILGIIPGGKKIRKYFQRYESSQQQLDGIVNSLLAGQEELRKDNIALEQERGNLWQVMTQLGEYGVLAEKLDGEIVGEVARLRQSGQVQAADIMESDLLFAVRQRRQDISTNLAVALQGFQVMKVIQQNNVQLIKGVESARTTTMFALRTAIMLASAIDTQTLVLDQIDALNGATNNAIEQTSVMLRQNSARIYEQASSSGVKVETLTLAFDNIFATIDEIDTFKKSANETMEKSINSLNDQFNRAKPHLERMQAADIADGSAKAVTS